jgi:hypothetical protein
MYSKATIAGFEDLFPFNFTEFRPWSNCRSNKQAMEWEIRSSQTKSFDHWKKRIQILIRKDAKWNDREDRFGGFDSC